MSQLSIKTRIETGGPADLPESFPGLSQLSIKTRIETTPPDDDSEDNEGLSQLSIKTRIETYFRGPLPPPLSVFESAIH